ncbi:MAG: hypothetical protein J6K20_12510 [Thermoguttaceae bacterium]|nr:hypothetical protein [Thermoguttaceae bacterium]
MTAEMLLDDVGENWGSRTLRLLRRTATVSLATFQPTTAQDVKRAVAPRRVALEGEREAFGVRG